MPSPSSSPAGKSRSEIAAGLFDAQVGDWVADPPTAFGAWLTSQGFRKSTQSAYWAMWGKFVRWLGENNIGLLEADGGHLARFLDANGLKKHHRQRYVRLIERIFKHLAHSDDDIVNPGSGAGRDRVGAGENDPTAFLVQQERERFWEFLIEAPDIEAGGIATYWKASRDRAMAALMLGAGLKVGEIVRLTVNCILEGGSWVRLAGPGVGRIHRARVLPFASECLRHWTEVRDGAGTLGVMAFSSNAKGKALHAASVWRRVLALMEEAGVMQNGEGRACPQTLRNSYAAHWFDAGESDFLVTEYMGLHEVVSAARLRVAYGEWLGEACER